MLGCRQWLFLLPLQARNVLRCIRGTDNIDAEFEYITAAAAAGSPVRLLSSLGPIALQHLEPAQPVEKPWMAQIGKQSHFDGQGHIAVWGTAI